MSVEKPVRDWKHSLTLRKHIPSGQQYVPADEVIATVKWDEEQAWDRYFRMLNEATERAVEDWRRPCNPPPDSSPGPRTQTPPELSPLSSILTPDQIELVECRIVGDVALVKSKNWLGQDVWRSLHEKLFSAGAKWISAGADSHWELSLAKRGS